MCARLRPSNQDGAAGTVEELTRIVSTIRQRWPNVSIIVRGDSGFCRDDILRWCEDTTVDYVIGLAKNDRLIEAIQTELAEAKVQCKETGKAARVYRDLPNPHQLVL